MKTVRVFIERGNDGTYGAYMPDDDGLNYGIIGDGNTVEEAKQDFMNVYEAMKEGFHEDGKYFEEVNFAFSYDVPSFLRYYCNIFSFAGLSRITGISAAQLSQYANGYRNPSKRTEEKIQKSLCAFGEELTKLQFC